MRVPPRQPNKFAVEDFQIFDRISIDFFITHKTHFFISSSASLQPHTASTINSHSILPKFPHAFPGHVCVCVCLCICAVSMREFLKKYFHNIVCRSRKDKKTESSAPIEKKSTYRFFESKKIFKILFLSSTSQAKPRIHLNYLWEN